MHLENSSTTGAGCVTQPVPPPAEIRVWDPLVRVFHWSLVTLFVFAFATGDALDRPHEIAGYAVLGLVVFRIAWGFMGSKHARFRDFVRRPSQIRAYLAEALRFRSRRYIGHNPAGGAMIVLMLTMVLVISATGIGLTTDAFWGSAWMEAAHETAVNLTLVLIGLHLTGVVVSSLAHGENLVRAMITGRKRPAGADDQGGDG